jgi:hypothetical protein
MLNLVEARRGPATVWTVFTPKPWLLNFGLTLWPQGEPLGEKLKSPEHLLGVWCNGRWSLSWDLILLGVESIDE